MPPKKQVTQCVCNRCSKIIRENSSSVQCSTCRNWTHANCTGLSSEDFKKIPSDIKKNKTAWKCDRCKFEVSVVLKKDLSDTESDYEDNDNDSGYTNEIKRMLEKFIKDFNEFKKSQAKSQAKLEAKFDYFKASVEDNLTGIRAEVSKLSKQNVSLTNKCAQIDNRINTVEDKLNSFAVTAGSPEEVIAEMNERKRRESNIIALNVAESKKKKMEKIA